VCVCGCGENGQSQLLGSGIAFVSTIKTTQLRTLAGGEEALLTSGFYNGMNLEEWVAPKPGLPCRVGLYVMENSPK
jgi:hypothetical protein